MNLHILSLCVIFLLHVSTDCTTSAQDQETPFDQNYFSLWGGDHVTILDQGKEVQIKIDEHSGGGTRSKQAYTFGIFQQRMKKPTRDSGILTTFYLTSLGDGGSSSQAHTELDFEFLGQSGPPYILSTNIFDDDGGHREQQLKLWFDPTSDFHDYKIVWNQYQIVFYVDEIPIRVFKNLTKVGVKYPVEAMHVYTSLWNSTQWLGPVNWQLGPFYANFRAFAIDGCLDGARECESSKKNWNAERFKQLDPKQQKMYETVRRKTMTYDYCKAGDTNKFPECKFI